MDKFIFTSGWESELHPSKDFGIKKIGLGNEWIQSLQGFCIKELPNLIREIDDSSSIRKRLIGKDNKGNVVVDISTNVTQTKDHVGRKTLLIEGTPKIEPLNWEFDKEGAKCTLSTKANNGGASTKSRALHFITLFMAILLMLSLGYISKQGSMLKELKAEREESHVSRLNTETGLTLNEALNWLEPLFPNNGEILSKMSGNSSMMAENELQKYLKEAYSTLNCLKDLYQKFIPVSSISKEFYQRFIPTSDISDEAKNLLKQDCPGSERAFTKPVQKLTDSRKIKEYAWAVYRRLQKDLLPRLKRSVSD